MFVKAVELAFFCDMTKSMRHVTLTAGDAHGQARCSESFHVIFRLLMAASHVTVLVIVIHIAIVSEIFDIVEIGFAEEEITDPFSRGGCSERWCGCPLESG